MKIVTSGAPYIDIDAYAGCVAFAELLCIEGHDATAISTAPQNESITRTIRSWEAPIADTYSPQGVDDTFILVDISDPNFFERFVALDRVEEVIDHHTGFETYWKKRLGKRSDIDFIGAACTLVYERWRKHNLLDQMSARTAGLLLAGILDNTLNLSAKVTCDRDRDAYTDLLRRSCLPKDWNVQYFEECQQAIEANVHQAISNDTKRFDDGKMPNVLGQMAVWSATRLISQKGQEIQQTLETMSPDWAINIISIGEATSYFLVGSEVAQLRLSHLLGISFENGIAKASRPWLRKEIIKTAARSRPGQ